MKVSTSVLEGFLSYVTEQILTLYRRFFKEKSQIHLGCGTN